tara:strand:+ start:1034 stop:1486 length:453 start_codon:yes stop_codon:yes gene_type:complete
MGNPSSINKPKSYGSEELDKMIYKLRSTDDPKRRYEYILWLAKNLPSIPEELMNKAIKVQGCISQVYILGELKGGRLKWQGYSDALITKGLLAFLIKGLNDLTPIEMNSIDIAFIEATGLKGSLTPSRANGFLNILLTMKTQAQNLINNS